MASLVSLVVVARDAHFDLHRCAAAKAQNPALLSVVSIKLSLATEFDRRLELRRKEFRDAHSLSARTVFRPSAVPMGNTSRHIQTDSRPVCVQSMFVISPWHELTDEELREPKQVVSQNQWRKIIAESDSHQDMLVAPTMIDSHTRARVLMYVLEWSRHTVPWADYIVNADTNINIRWRRIIELFPPPVPQTRASHSLWHLGSSDSSIDTLFFKDPRVGTWRQCPDMSGVAAFSRDLVRQMTSMPFSTQIEYALSHPFGMHKERCKVGSFWRSTDGFLLLTAFELTVNCVLAGRGKLGARAANHRVWLRKTQESALTGLSPCWRSRWLCPVLFGRTFLVTRACAHGNLT